MIKRGVWGSSLDEGVMLRRVNVVGKLVTAGGEDDPPRGGARV